MSGDRNVTGDLLQEITKSVFVSEEGIIILAIFKQKFLCASYTLYKNSRKNSVRRVSIGMKYNLDRLYRISTFMISREGSSASKRGEVCGIVDCKNIIDETTGILQT